MSTSQEDTGTAASTIMIFTWSPDQELFPLFDRVRQRHLGLNVSYICLSPKDRNCRHYEYKHSYKTLLDKSCHQQSQPATSVLQRYMCLHAMHSGCADRQYNNRNQGKESDLRGSHCPMHARHECAHIRCPDIQKCNKAICLYQPHAGNAAKSCQVLKGTPPSYMLERVLRQLTQQNACANRSSNPSNLLYI